MVKIFNFKENLIEEIHKSKKYYLKNFNKFIFANFVIKFSDDRKLRISSSDGNNHIVIRYTLWYQKATRF